jgi:hypothetical protein
MTRIEPEPAAPPPASVASKSVDAALDQFSQLHKVASLGSSKFAMTTWPPKAKEAPRSAAGNSTRLVYRAKQQFFIGLI